MHPMQSNRLDIQKVPQLKEIAKSQTITELIGNTPLLKLQQIVPAEAAEVYVKLEFFNPGGSIKDRIALAMIQAAE